MSADSTPPIRFAWIRRAPATPGNRAQKMHIHYRDELRLFPNRLRRCALGVLILAWAFIPVLWDFFPFHAVQRERGFAEHVGVRGSLCDRGHRTQPAHRIHRSGLTRALGFLGRRRLQHCIRRVCLGVWPMWLWILFAPAMGWLVGAAVGPFALRLRGNYLVIVTLGLVFIGEHIFRNWKSVTGGNTGTSAAGVEVKLGFIDFENLSLFGKSFGKDESYFWLIWFLVALVAWLTKNVVRTRPGRALQAVRDRDIAAEIIGINVGITGYKTQAFAWSAAIAALAGALYAPLQLFISPGDFTLLVSIQFHCDDYLGGDGHDLWIDHRCAGDHGAATTDRWHFGRLRCTWSGSQEHRLWSRVCCFA